MVSKGWVVVEKVVLHWAGSVVPFAAVVVTGTVAGGSTEGASVVNAVTQVVKFAAVV